MATEHDLTAARAGLAADLRIFEIETLGGVYDLAAPSRAAALAIHEESYPHTVLIDSKDKTAKRIHEIARCLH